MKFYRTADYLTSAEIKSLGLKSGDVSMWGKTPKGYYVMAVYTGVKRPPKQGEWYLSGASVVAYRAPNDLSTAYHIAKLCLTETITRSVTKLIAVSD